MPANFAGSLALFQAVPGSYGPMTIADGPEEVQDVLPEPRSADA